MEEILKNMCRTIGVPTDATEKAYQEFCRKSLEKPENTSVSIDENFEKWIVNTPSKEDRKRFCKTGNAVRPSADTTTRVVYNPDEFTRFVGHRQTIEQLKSEVIASIKKFKATQERTSKIENPVVRPTLRNILFEGPPGIGKTALAFTVVNEINKRLADDSQKIRLWSFTGLSLTLENLNQIFDTNRPETERIREGDVVFIDEIQAITTKVSTALLTVLTEGQYYGKGVVSGAIPRFSVIAATTDPNRLLRNIGLPSRFPLKITLLPLSDPEISELVLCIGASYPLNMQLAPANALEGIRNNKQFMDTLKSHVENVGLQTSLRLNVQQRAAGHENRWGCERVAEYARGIPRVALDILVSIETWYLAKNAKPSEITGKDVDQVMYAQGWHTLVSENPKYATEQIHVKNIEWQYLLALYSRNKGKEAISVQGLSQLLALNADTLQGFVEQYLLERRLIRITSKGRSLTKRGKSFLRGTLRRTENASINDALSDIDEDDDEDDDE